MSRGARAVARLLAGAPAASVNLDDLDADWRPLAEALLDAADCDYRRWQRIVL